MTDRSTMDDWHELQVQGNYYCFTTEMTDGPLIIVSDGHLQASPEVKLSSTQPSPKQFRVKKQRKASSCQQPILSGTRKGAELYLPCFFLQSHQLVKSPFLPRRLSGAQTDDRNISPWKVPPHGKLKEQGMRFLPSFSDGSSKWGVKELVEGRVV